MLLILDAATLIAMLSFSVWLAPNKLFPLWKKLVPDDDEPPQISLEEFVRLARLERMWVIQKAGRTVVVARDGFVERGAPGLAGWNSTSTMAFRLKVIWKVALWCLGIDYWKRYGDGREGELRNTLSGVSISWSQSGWGTGM